MVFQYIRPISHLRDSRAYVGQLYEQEESAQHNKANQFKLENMFLHAFRVN